MNIRHFLLLPHIRIHNANAMSSPYTIGFPAMTAWLGAAHALQRHLRHQGFAEIQLNNVAVSCHQFDLQTYKGPNDFVHSIVGTANPLDKNGERPAFIEEARCHLRVSLLIEFIGVDSDERETLAQCIQQLLQRMKFAGGDMLSAQQVETLAIDQDDDNDIKKILRKLMLGHVLIERRELMQEAMQSGQDALAALLDHLKIMHRAEQDQDGNVSWTSKRKTSGWLIPIAVGFQGISELGLAKNQRDLNTQHRFAESMLTLGEFVLPYRINNLDDILWQTRVDLDNHLYLCQTLSNQQILGA